MHLVGCFIRNRNPYVQVTWRFASIHGVALRHKTTIPFTVTLKKCIITCMFHRVATVTVVTFSANVDKRFQQYMQLCCLRHTGTTPVTEYSSTLIQ